MKKPLILMPSKQMDKNRKSDRHEDRLIRVGEKAREYLGLNGETNVELWSNSTVSNRINRSKILQIHQAFNTDLNKVKNKGTNPEEYLRIGFVTTNTFEFICGNNSGNEDIWVSNSIDDTVIGGDPEFLLLDTDNVAVYASEIERFASSGELGSDGPLAEIRPKPEIEVDELVNSIGRILESHANARLIKKYGWAACCYWLGKGYDRYGNDRMKWPVGGHIHIGTPLQLRDKKISDYRFNHFYYVTLTKILDELLAIPLTKVDGEKESKKRREEYGKFGDHRTEHDRLEYRTLSGMWLAHPKLAGIVLGTAKAIVDSYFQMVESKNFETEYISGSINTEVFCFHGSFTSWDKIPIMNDFGTTMKSADMRNALHKYEIKYDKAYINQLTEKLRRLPVYNKYAEYIDGLIELVSLPYNKIEKINRDLKATWIEGADFII